MRKRDYMWLAIIFAIVTPLTVWRFVHYGYYVVGIETFIAIFGVLAVAVGGAYESDDAD